MRPRSVRFCFHPINRICQQWTSGLVKWTPSNTMAEGKAATFIALHRHCRQDENSILCPFLLKSKPSSSWPTDAGSTQCGAHGRFICLAFADASTPFFSSRQRPVELQQHLLARYTKCSVSSIPAFYSYGNRPHS